MDRRAPARVTGTPLYLAPEVLEHGEASVQSDIYSLGVLLYHLVTNDYPVRGQTPAELIDAHKQGRVRHLRDVAPGLPAWFVRAIERAIAPDPRNRFPTAGEFEAALSGRTSIKVWPVLLAIGLTLAAAAVVQQMWSRLSAPANSTPLVAILPLNAGLGVSDAVAAAVTDEIYQGLAMVDTLRVISSFSAAKAKRDQTSMSSVADALQASTVIDGTVSEVEGQLEVNLRVFEAGSDTPVSAQTFLAAKAGFGSLRRDTALSMANVMKVAVSSRILAQLARSPTLNTQAYDAFTVGRHLHERAGLTDFERAKARTRRPSLSPPPTHPHMAHWLACTLKSPTAGVRPGPPTWSWQRRMRSRPLTWTRVFPRRTWFSGRWPFSSTGTGHSQRARISARSHSARATIGRGNAIRTSWRRGAGSIKPSTSWRRRGC